MCKSVMIRANYFSRSHFFIFQHMADATTTETKAMQSGTKRRALSDFESDPQVNKKIRWYKPSLNTLLRGNIVAVAEFLRILKKIKSEEGATGVKFEESISANTLFLCGGIVKKKESDSIYDMITFLKGVQRTNLQLLKGDIEWFPTDEKSARRPYKQRIEDILFDVEEHLKLMHSDPFEEIKSEARSDSDSDSDDDEVMQIEQEKEVEEAEEDDSDDGEDEEEEEEKDEDEKGSNYSSESDDEKEGSGEEGSGEEDSDNEEEEEDE